MVSQKTKCLTVFLTHTIHILSTTDDFRAHTSCISEAERYEKSVYRGGNKKAKKNPQEAWMELISSASTSAPGSIRHYMEMLASLGNVPRKPKQFRNFTANSLNLRGKQATEVVDSLWNHLTMLRNEQQEAKKMEEEEQKRLKEEAEKNKSDTVSKDTSQQEESAPSDKLEKKVSDTAKLQPKGKDVSAKKVRKAMKKVLKKAPGRSMKIKELRRAVRQYLECDDSGKPMVKQLIGDELKGANNRIKVDGKLVILQ
jgi:cell growth-regulating nucleolar protein